MPVQSGNNWTRKNLRIAKIDKAFCDFSVFVLMRRCCLRPLRHKRRAKSTRTLFKTAILRLTNVSVIIRFSSFDFYKLDEVYTKIEFQPDKEC